MSVGVAAAAVVTGWGRGVVALPAEARTAATGRRIIVASTPPPTGERFRRATRECLLAVDAVHALLDDVGLDRDAIAGPTTALVYVTAAAYGGSNRLFIEADGGRGGALHFPYTAPSALPAEIAIEFGLTGPYVIFIGDAPTAREAVWYASRLLADRLAERALVVGVETFAECEDLWARGRWVAGRPLTEAAACVLLSREGRPMPDNDAWARLEARAAWRAGETLACRPLIALALADAGRATAAR